MGSNRSCTYGYLHILLKAAVVFSSLAYSLQWSTFDEIHQNHFPRLMQQSSIKYDKKFLNEQKQRKLGATEISLYFQTILVTLWVTHNLNRCIKCHSNDIHQLQEESHTFWDRECQRANKIKQQSLNKFRRCPQFESLIDFKKGRAGGRISKIEAKRKSQSNYDCSMNIFASQVWKEKGEDPERQIPSID